MAGLQRDVAILQENSSRLIVWDRGWPADAVYSKLLHRDHRFGRDPWLAEWLYGRVVATLGSEFILAGPSPDVLAAKRDDTDLPVDPAKEQATYASYAQLFGLPLIHTKHAGRDEATFLADRLVDFAASRTRIQRPARLPYLTGSLFGPVFVVDEGDAPRLEGGWLVGTSERVTAIARNYGIAALSASWLDVRYATELTKQLTRCRFVYAVGSDVYTYIRSLGIDHAACV